MTESVRAPSLSTYSFAVARPCAHRRHPDGQLRGNGSGRDVDRGHARRSGVAHQGVATARVERHLGRSIPYGDAVVLVECLGIEDHDEAG